jgi:hypothetical protein
MALKYAPSQGNVKKKKNKKENHPRKNLMQNKEFREGGGK